MADSTWWWIITGVLIALELVSLTFYLLMLALGAAAGALAAHAGASPATQIIVAALVGGVAVIACYLARRRRPGDPSARAERSVNLDVGEIVQIDGWNADGTAHIRYRGAPWQVLHRPGVVPRPGPHRPRAPDDAQRLPAPHQRKTDHDAAPGLCRDGLIRRPRSPVRTLVRPPAQKDRTGRRGHQRRRFDRHPHALAAAPRRRLVGSLTRWNDRPMRPAGRLQGASGRPWRRPAFFPPIP